MVLPCVKVPYHPTSERYQSFALQFWTQRFILGGCKNIDILYLQQTVVDAGDLPAKNTLFSASLFGAANPSKSHSRSQLKVSSPSQ
jgi:hypothetical protein